MSNMISLLDAVVSNLDNLLYNASSSNRLGFAGNKLPPKSNVVHQSMRPIQVSDTGKPQFVYLNQQGGEVSALKSERQRKNFEVAAGEGRAKMKRARTIADNSNASYGESHGSNMATKVVKTSIKEEDNSVRRKMSVEKGKKFSGGSTSKPATQIKDEDTAETSTTSNSRQRVHVSSTDAYESDEGRF